MGRTRPIRALTWTSIVAASAFATGCPRDDVERAPPVVRVGDDLIGSGAAVTVTDSVPGDVMLAGGELAFAGIAGGDLLLAGGNQVVGGRAAGSLRAAGGEVRVTGEIGRNATVAGGTLRFDRGATIGGNGYIAGSSVRTAASIQGSLRVAAGTIVIDGPVGGDADIQGERLTVGPDAVIGGDLRHRVPAANVEIDPRARIDGRVIAEPPPRTRGLLRYTRFLLFVGFLVAGGVAIGFFPRTAGTAARAIGERPFAALGFGLAWVIGIPIVIGIIAITVVGIPLAIIVAALYAIALYLGRAFLAVWLGRAILRDRLSPGRAGHILGFLAGALLLGALSLLPILGPLVTAVATIFGLGGLAIAVSGAVAPEPASAGGPGA